MPLTHPPIDAHTLALLQMAVREDLGDVSWGERRGDKTVELSVPADVLARAKIVARVAGTLAGGYLLPAILKEYQAEGPGATCSILTPDGARLQPDQAVAEFSGPARTLLSAERVMLNFLSHLSGIATLTRRYVDAVAPIAAKNNGRPAICDTRKTTPAFRTLDKYAVRCGGGVNHRMGLYDGVMLKDNHLAALRDRLGEGGTGTLAQLTSNIRAALDPRITLWLEVDTLTQLAEVLHRGAADGPGPDIVLLDNFTPDQMRQAVKLRDQAAIQSRIKNPPSKILLEASGGITLENILPVAETGVDRVSIGALTHSAPILDLSMEFGV